MILLEGESYNTWSQQSGCFRRLNASYRAKAKARLSMAGCEGQIAVPLKRPLWDLDR